MEGETLMLMAVCVKGRTGEEEEQKEEKNSEHVKLSELQIELGLNPQVAVDKQ